MSRIAVHLAPLAAILVLIAAMPALAANVSLDYRFDRNETSAHARQAALEKGFAAAVAESALGMLPARPDAATEALLDEFLAPRAGKFVLTYSDVRTAVKGDVLSLSMEVSVNRAELRRYLQEIGLFHALSGNVTPLSLTVTGANEDELKTLSSLRALGGFALQANATPSIAIRKTGKESWEGVMNAADGQWSAKGVDPEAVWQSLTARYFNAKAENPFAQAAGDRLMVEGWYSPDGVREFDSMLRSWDDAVAEVSLASVSLLPAGVSATWDLKALSPGVLRERLNAYLSERGLTYSMAGGK